MAEFSPWLIVALLLALLLWRWLLRGPRGRVAETDWRAGDAIFAACLGAYFLLAIMSGGRGDEALSLSAIWAGIVFYTVMTAALLVFLGARGHDVGRAFGLVPVGGLGRALGLGGVAIAATYPLVLASEQLVRVFGRNVSDDDGLVQFLQGTSGPGVWGVVTLLALVVAPVAEELIFRGFLYGVLRKHFGSISAMVATAALFAAIHLNVPAMPAYFLLAIGFTLAYERTGSLWTPIFMHALFNGISLGIIVFFPEWMNVP